MTWRVSRAPMPRPRAGGSTARSREVELALARKRGDRTPGSRRRDRPEKIAGRGVLRDPDLVLLGALGDQPDRRAVAFRDVVPDRVSALGEIGHGFVFVRSHEPDRHVIPLAQPTQELDVLDGGPVLFEGAVGDELVA